MMRNSRHPVDEIEKTLPSMEEPSKQWTSTRTFHSCGHYTKYASK